eukprot:XP_014768100.1 PREDICTED: uncharacterized protein LOC106867677 [Octopus bimaculoides]
MVMVPILELVTGGVRPMANEFWSGAHYTDVIVYQPIKAAMCNVQCGLGTLTVCQREHTETVNMRQRERIPLEHLHACDTTTHNLLHSDENTPSLHSHQRHCATEDMPLLTLTMKTLSIRRKGQGSP